MLEENQGLKEERAKKQSKIKFLSLKLSKQRVDKKSAKDAQAIIDNLVQRNHKLKNFAEQTHKRFVSSNVQKRLNYDDYVRTLKKERQALKRQSKLTVSAVLRLLRFGTDRGYPTISATCNYSDEYLINLSVHIGGQGIAHHGSGRSGQLSGFHHQEVGH